MVKAGQIVKSILSHWKIIVIVVLAIVIIGQIDSCRGKQALNLAWANKYDLLKSGYEEQIHYWKDEYGKQHAVTREIQLEKEAMKLYSDSIARQLKIKPKQVVGTSTSVGTIEVSGKPDVKIKYDTIPCPDSGVAQIPKTLNFSWEDQWNYIGGVIDLKDSTKNIVIFVGQDSLTRTMYWQRKKFLGLAIGPKEYYVDFSNSNPSVQLKAYKGVRLGETPKRFGIGPSVQWMYPNRVTFGIGLQYNIIRF